MRFSPSFLDDIRNKLPISQIVSRKVKLKRSGQGFVGLCPCHNDHNPSMHVSDQRGTWKCFVCQAGGDVIRFVTETQGLSFVDAVKSLASDAGLALPDQSEFQIKAEVRRRSLTDVLEISAQWYQDQLKSPSAASVRDYLGKRGISAASIEQFRIGYAPDGNRLKGYLASKGISNELAAEAGLAAVTERGECIDRFRNRLMVPILSGNRVASFGGRAMGDHPAKYINGSETPCFSKGSVLFNADAARQPAWDGARVICVEGYMDVVASTQSGFPASVAPMGTAVTDDQLRLLWRLSDEPVICLDGDIAGTKAAYRLLDLALPMIIPGRSLRFAMLPAGMDPDDVIRKNGPAAYKAAIDSAWPMVDVLWHRETHGKTFATPEATAKLAETLYGAINQIKDSELKSLYRQDIRDRLFHMNRRPKITRSNGHTLHSSSPASHRLMQVFNKTGINLKEATLLLAMITVPNIAMDAAEDIIRDDSLSPEARTAIGQILEALTAMPEGSAEALLLAIRAQGGGEAIDTAVEICRSSGLGSIQSSREAAAEIIRGSLQ